MMLFRFCKWFQRKSHLRGDRITNSMVAAMAVSVVAISAYFPVKMWEGCVVSGFVVVVALVLWRMNYETTV